MCSVHKHVGAWAAAAGSTRQSSPVVKAGLVSIRSNKEFLGVNISILEYDNLEIEQISTPQVLSSDCLEVN